MYWTRLTQPLFMAKVGAAALVILGASAQPYRVVVVKGKSMMPTYQDGSILLTETLNRPPRVGEVVVVDSPVGTLIKRVAFGPGDSFPQLKTANGWLDLVGITARVKVKRNKLLRMFRVPEGQVYVLGDNRARSIDSTSFGTLPISQIRGTLLDQKARVTAPYVSDLTQITRGKELAQAKVVGD